MAKRYKLLLTETQLNLVTTCLHEWAGLCVQESENRFGRSGGNLMKESKKIDKVFDSIQRQVRKQKYSE